MGSHDVKQDFNMEIIINGEKLKVKAFVENTLGAVIEGLKIGLKAMPEESEKSTRKIEINFDNEEVKHVLFNIGEKKIPLNFYVQEMIANTISGFLLSLNDVPDSFEKMKASPIQITYTRLD